MTDILDIQLPETWPQEISVFLEKNQEIIIGRQCSCCEIPYTPAYDRVYEHFQNILKNYSLIGFHCTKLVKQEIDEIKRSGMSLQDLESLSKRIDLLQDKGLISSHIARELKTNNNANDKRRSHMLWFCFFKPNIAGRSGIQCFFRYWGGEALYGSHQMDPVIGVESKIGIKLQEIGIPSIIKVKVPISFLAEYSIPVGNMFRVFLESKGHNLDQETEHEGYSVKSIPAENILKIIEYPSQEFVTLTKCNEWYDYID